jgi:hypothetical protein
VVLTAIDPKSKRISLTLLVIFESTSLQQRQAAIPKIPKAIDTIATILEEMIRNRSFISLLSQERAGKSCVIGSAYKIALQ